MISVGRDGPGPGPGGGSGGSPDGAVGDDGQASRDRNPRNNAATAASAASVRAVSAQVVAFYFRAPAKAFFRTRVDYLGFARQLHDAQTRKMARALERERLLRAQAGNGSFLGGRLLFKQAWMVLRSTTPGVLTSAVRHQGWSVIPQQVLPPLMANVGVGAVLYTSYLHLLGMLHPPSSLATKRVYPPPPPSATFAAGLAAGALQSVLAAPLDALQARYDHRDLMASGTGSRPQSMWTFGAEKLREIGARGVFAGWSLSLAKDSLGSAVFFSAFEYVKAQAYYGFVTWYYGDLGEDMVNLLALKRPPKTTTTVIRDDDFSVTDHSVSDKLIKPHYALEPMFLLAAGTTASLAQQVFLHPLTHLQVKHWDRLEDLDAEVSRLRERQMAAAARPGGAAAAGSAAGSAPGAAPGHSPWALLRTYYQAYQETWAACAAEARAEGLGLTRWLYRGFWWNSIRQVPSTSAGLVIFELIRRKYGFGTEEVRIEKDGYSILLN